jgi:hypothetical protein
LLKGFKYGFKLNYARPRSSYAYDNLLSIKQNPDLATKSINEIELGRMAGPFKDKPIYIIFAVHQLGLFKKRRILSDLG